MHIRSILSDASMEIFDRGKAGSDAEGTRSPHTVGAPVGQQQVGEQALLDCGLPTQVLLVQGQKEAVELHQDLVQHWRGRHATR